MRYRARIFGAITIIAATWGSISHAAFFGFPRALRFQVEKVTFDQPALAPIAHARFCLQYPDDCSAMGGDFRRRNVALTEERWNELAAINRDVNRDIVPHRNLGGLSAERWLVSPASGECHDYAVTKRHELLARGWPERALLLSEVVANSGEHHLVLLVRMKNVDLVLDNLNANILPATRTPYRWVRVESPHNPRFWSTVSMTPAAHVAMRDADGL
jgi:predicted transglutaminase-like cysteine proteinase